MKIRVACVQQKARIYPDEDSFREWIRFFMKKASGENCSLIAFPEGVGAMLAPQFMPRPLVKVLMTAYNEEEGASAVKAAGKALLGKFLDRVTAGQDLTATFNETLKKHGRELRESYLRVFSSVAREHGMYVVGGSAYVPDEKTGKIVNAAYMFGPDGEVLGYQNKIHLYIEDTHICEPGTEIRVFDTDFGKIGLPICYEGMFPEISRLMVLQGARALINVSACPGEACFAKIRAGAWSRVQDNQVFGMHSCLVGRNDLSKEFTADYVGRSSILAPLDYTRDLSGVLAEAGSLDGEEMLVAAWDYKRLDELISRNDTPIYRDLQLDLVKKFYSAI
jgi:predicted amidohydrolase